MLQILSVPMLVSRATQLESNCVLISHAVGWRLQIDSCSTMGWEELEAECLQSSQESGEKIQEAECFRTPSEPGESADEQSSCSSQLSQGIVQPWWVQLLLKHASKYSYQDVSASEVRILSGCSGMAAEAFALQDSR